MSKAAAVGVGLFAAHACGSGLLLLWFTWVGLSDVRFVGVQWLIPVGVAFGACYSLVMSIVLYLVARVLWADATEAHTAARL